MSLWGNGIGKRYGGIEIELSDDGYVWKHKMTKWGLRTQYKVDVGAGIPVAVVGKHGHEIDCLGFISSRRSVSRGWWM